MNPLQFFPSNLKRLRERRGLSQSDLAQALWGEDRQSNISRLENGVNSPSLELAVMIATALKTTVGALIAPPKGLNEKNH
jgi:transcriptional regulator with XRE-family HTH domain